MKKRIMILGAGIYQVPLIRKAKKMGLETLVVSPAGKYPGISIADRHLDIDTTDVDRVVRAATDYSIDGITTTGTDVCLPALGKVVDTLGIPGTGYEAALASTDKVLMKQAFTQHKVPTAAFQSFTDPLAAQIFADQLSYPVMVKASDSSGSRGVTKVSSSGEFRFAWDRALSASRSADVIVEDFLEGFEFGAQALVHGNRVVAVIPHRDTVSPAPFMTPIGHALPMALCDSQQQEVFSVVARAVSALGIRDCVSNVDLVMVDGEPKIIEIGARMGATCLPENLSIYSGTDLYEHLVRLALGDFRGFEPLSKLPNASLLIRSPKTGAVKSIWVPDEVLRHPDLIELQWDISAGSYVRKFETGPDRIGHLIVKAQTAEEAEQLAHSLVSLIAVEVNTNKFG